MVKPIHKPKGNSKRNIVIIAVLAQIAFDIFSAYRLQHQETMNREQVKFDMGVANKVFGQDYSRQTNVVRLTPSISGDRKQ